MSRANYLSSASSLIRGVVKMNIIETLQKYDYQSVVIIDDKIGITDPLVTIDQLREIDGIRYGIRTRVAAVKGRCPNP